MSYKLFIPGPIAVSEKTLQAMAQPMIGHRSTDFVALYQGIQPDLQALFYTQDPVYLSTSSAWGVMEGSRRLGPLALCSHLARRSSALLALRCAALRGCCSRSPRSRAVAPRGCW